MDDNAIALFLFLALLCALMFGLGYEFRQAKAEEEEVAYWELEKDYEDEVLEKSV